MLRLDREQAISVAAFVLLLLVSVTVMGCRFRRAPMPCGRVPNVVRCSRASKPGCG